MTHIPAPLWHYTCHHGRMRIGQTGWLKPGPDGYVWLTDLEVPYREALGLTSVLIECDRTAHRYRVDQSADVHAFVGLRNVFDPLRWDALMAVPGGLVRHWYVCAMPVRAVLEERPERVDSRR